MKKLACFVGVAMAALLSACGTGTPNSFTIDQPSAAETSFAEKRDFYVIGSFSAGVAQPGDIRIELYRISPGGPVLVRSIQSAVDPSTGTTPLSSIEQNYAEGSNFGIIMVPDLVKEPGGFLDPTNKVVVTDTYYAGIILGGATKDFDTAYAASDGTPYEDLTEGSYEIVVSGLSHDLKGAAASKAITMGLTHASLGRFTPASSKAKLFAYAAAHGQRTYGDDFPGYFAMGGNLYEIKNRWMPNNAIEVVNDVPGTVVDNAATAVNDLLVYNVRPTAATTTIEIAALLRYELTESANTLFHYYDVGEPTLAYVDLQGASQSVDGSFADFAEGDHLVLIRAEVFPDNGVSDENLYNIADPTPKAMDLNVADGVTVSACDELSLYGAVRPIPSTVTAGTHSHEFTPDNTIDTIVYTITDANGAVVETSTHEIDLGRIYDAANPASIASSYLEFRHEFVPDFAAGSYTVSAQGYDENGAEVAGTAERFTMTIP